MKTSDLVFIGIKGSVVALESATGRQVWVTRLIGTGEFVNVHLQGERVLASCHGEIFCLGPQAGNVLWHNPLKGFGLGMAAMATESDRNGDTATALAEQRQRSANAAAAAASS